MQKNACAVAVPSDVPSLVENQDSQQHILHPVAILLLGVLF